MSKNSSYRRFGALALILVFSATWSLKSIHEFFRHHHDHPVCTAAFDGQTTHLHDERYIGDDCSLCAFVLFVPEVITITALVATPSKLPDTVPPVFYQPPSGSKTACDSTLRRGPPVI
ncbi:MAG: hypothetical protein IPJ82_03600 [Lewinellaceae bacterium]|nr:hypothetical protein [Lewinellaceae bacterium]